MKNLGLGIIVAGVSSLAVAMASTANAEPKTQLLTQWESGGDAEAVKKLGEMYEAAGGSFESVGIAGHTANTLAKLRADVISGNAPPAVQMMGPAIGQWTDTGMTANLDAIAEKEGWDSVVVPQLLSIVKPEGSWVAAPVNVHRINWMWTSPSVLEGAGVTDIPTTWEEFNAACDKVIASGKICLSHSAADWTDATVFEIIVYGQDLDLYTKAFVDGDTDAMRSDGMMKAFDQFRIMNRDYMDPGKVGRDWGEMSNLVAKGDAAFHILGDWTVGTLTSNGWNYGSDYVCAPAPKEWEGPGYIMVSDSFLFFEQTDPDFVEGQELLSTLILSPEFQTLFNKTKGSVPARMDIEVGEGWNPCQKLASQALKDASDAETLRLSMAHNMTLLPDLRGAVLDVVTEFAAAPEMTSEEAVNLMADAVEDAM